VETLHGVDCVITLSPSLDAPYSGTFRIFLPGNTGNKALKVITVKTQKLRSVFGRVVDSTGNPLEDVKVVCAMRSPGVGKTTKSSQTNNEGVFNIPLIPLDVTDLILYGKSDNYVIERRSVPINGDEKIVLIAAIRNNQDVRFRLVHNTPTGAVIIPYEGTVSLKGPVTYMKEVTGGNFVLPKLTPGKYTLDLTGLNELGFILVNPSFEVAEGIEIIDLSVSKLHTVSLMVNDADSGKPISAASIFVLQNGRRTSAAKTDEGGNVNLLLPISGLLPYGSLQIVHPSYLPVDIPIPRDDLTVQLSQGLSFEGIVSDINGKPIADAEVIIFTNGGRELVARTGDLGAFVLQNLPVGKITAIIRAKGYAPIGARVSLPYQDKFEASLGPGITVKFLIEVDLPITISNQLTNGALILLDDRTMSPVSFLPGSPGMSQELRISPGKYTVLCWVGSDYFIVDKIEIKAEGIVRISINKLGEQVQRPF
jgi:hypothetical protein